MFLALRLEQGTRGQGLQTAPRRWEWLWQRQGRKGTIPKEWGLGPPGASREDHSPMSLPLVSDLQHLRSHTLWCRPLCLRSFVRAALENQCSLYHSLVALPKSLFFMALSIF